MRSALLLLVLASGPYRVVLNDGTVLTLKAAPEEKRGRLVGTVAATGTLVSVRSGDVDRVLTEAANREAQVVDSPPTRSVGVSAKGVPLGDRVKLIVSPGEARTKLESASGTAKPASVDDVPERAEPGENRTPKLEAHRDNDGHGEAWWRAKAGRLREDVAEARLAREIAEENVGRWERDMPVGDLAIQTWARELAYLRDRADRSRRELVRAQQKLEDLTDQARRANAYPGWLR